MVKEKTEFEKDCEGRLFEAGRFTVSAKRVWHGGKALVALHNGSECFAAPGDWILSFEDKVKTDERIQPFKMVIPDGAYNELFGGVHYLGEDETSGLPIGLFTVGEAGESPEQEKTTENLDPIV